MAQIAPVAQQFFDNNGDPLNGGKVYFYVAGTTTPKDTYTTSEAATANANPVVLDSAGRAEIWGTGTYRMVVKTSADVTLSDRDNVNISTAIFGGDGNSISHNDDTNAILGGDDNAISGASTRYAGIVGGTTNAIYANDGNAIVGGTGNEIYGDSSGIIGGVGNYVDVDVTGCLVSGSGNEANADYATVSGSRAVAGKYGQRVHASGRFSANGDAQTSLYVLRGVTTTSTPAEIFLDGSSARMTIPADTTWGFDIMVVARRADANDESAFYRFEGAIDNNAGTTALVGSVVAATPIEDTAAWACAVTADNTNDALIITVTGENSKTIRWVAYVRTVEVTG